MSEPTPLLPPLKPKQVAARLWRHGALTPDDWQSVGDDEPLPIAGRAIVTIARWRGEQPALVASGVPVGVKLGVGDTLDPVADDVQRLSLIALPFPKFSDGRSYSTARRLREAGYAGELRATGDVLLDQVPLMLRAGFDALEITHAATVAALHRGEVPAVPQIYQKGAERGAIAVAFKARPTRK
jgi:uncharacterized protein (DUF934 family)